MRVWLLSLCLSLAAISSQVAADGFDPEHKLVIQVSSDDPRTHKLALSNAINVQKALGMDNVAIEIVAYGPGLSLVAGASEQSPRVPNLILQGIEFTACGNTINSMEQSTGQKISLVEGVSISEAGVVRIMELQAQGYHYIRP